MHDHYILYGNKLKILWKFIEGRVVQKRTNSIEKPQSKPTQTETTKNCIWFRCIQIIFLLNYIVWFAVFILPTKANKMKPQHKKNVN